MRRSLSGSYGICRTKRFNLREGFAVWNTSRTLVDGHKIMTFGYFQDDPVSFETMAKWGYFESLPDPPEIELFPDVTSYDNMQLAVFGDFGVVMTIPYYFYILGTRRVLQVRVWWCKDKDDGPDLADLVLKVNPLDASELQLGSELASYAIAGLTEATAEYIPNGLDMGSMTTNSYKDIYLGFHAPPSVQSTGEVYMKVDFEAGIPPSDIGDAVVGGSAHYGGQDAPIDQIVLNYDIILAVHCITSQEAENLPGTVTGVPSHIEWSD